MMTLSLVAQPSAPTGLTVLSGSGQAELRWPASVGATAYNVQRSVTNGGPYSVVTTVTGTNYVDTGLSNAASYYYVITATNAQGSSPNSPQATAIPVSTNDLYEIIGQQSGLALNNVNDGSSTLDQQPVVNDMQRWQFVYAGNSGFLIKRGTNAVSAPNLSSPLQLQPTTGTANQLWTFEVINGTAYYIIRNVASGQLMNAFYASIDAGTPIGQWPYTVNATNQNWSVLPKSRVYISNMDQTGGNLLGVTSNQWGATRFTVGNHLGGYVVDSVSVSMANAFGTPGQMTLAVYSDNNNQPGKLLQVLSGNATPTTAGIYTFTATNLVLAPYYARYWIVAKGSTATGSYRWNESPYFSTYTAIDGWSMPLRGTVDAVNMASSDNGSTWHSLGSDGPTLFSIKASGVSQSFSSNGRYFQDFLQYQEGATNLADGSQFLGTSLGQTGGCRVVDSSLHELALTATGYSNVASVFQLPDLNPGAPVYAFSAKWNACVYGNFTATDGGNGFSFNYGQLNGTNLLVGAIESGYGTGLSFDVQTYTNGAPGFYIRVNGQVVAQQPYIPSTQWGVFNGYRHLFEVDWNYYTGMTVRVDGQGIFTNVLTKAFRPRSGDRMVWAARSSNVTADVRLDNIAVVSGGNLTYASPTSPYFQDPGAYYSSGSLVFTNGPWVSNENYPNTYWVGGTLAQANSVVAYVINEGPNGGWGPVGFWTLEGSPDGGNTWNTVDAEQARWVAYSESRAFMVTPDDSRSYGAYQLHVFGQDPFKFSVMVIGNLQFYTFTPVESPPALSATAFGNSVQLTWPTNVAGLVLLQTSNFGSTYTQVTNSVSVVNGKNQVTVPVSSTKAFFVLGTP